MLERSFCPTRDALLGLLRHHGYSQIEVAHDWEHVNGPIVNLAAYSWVVRRIGAIRLYGSVTASRYHRRR
jgi:hypothetical protein